MESQEEQLVRLNENFSKATRNFSKVARTWAFTILASGLTFLLREDICSIEWLPFAVIALSILCVVIDSIQYIYTAVSTRCLINDILNSGNIDLDEESKLSKKIQERSYKILIVKFWVLIFNTLCLFMFLISKLRLLYSGIN